MELVARTPPASYPRLMALLSRDRRPIAGPARNLLFSSWKTYLAELSPGERSRLRNTLEADLWRQGVHLVAGLDEAGRGPLAGPVVAAAVIIKPGEAFPGLSDPKEMGEAEREFWLEEIKRRAAAVSVATAGVLFIDRHNILRASWHAMRSAVARLRPRPEWIIVDGFDVPGMPILTMPLVKGESFSNSVAAAAVVAKTFRDRLMVRLDARFPGYGFARNKGYPTREHRLSLRVKGPSVLHRKSFRLVDETEESE